MKNNLKLKHLLILSDINGFIPEIDPSVLPLKQFDAIDRIDSRTLAGVNPSMSQDYAHDAFVNGGIDAAANNLIAQYPGGLSVALGLSIGGVILWRAVPNGLPIGKLICFSSTRLRFEKQPPNCDLSLYYGETDAHRPDENWFSSLGIGGKLLPDAGHEFYKTQLGVDIFYRELE